MENPKVARVAAVIPCFRVARHIEGVLSSLPESVHHIIVVDDCCPENTGAIAEEMAQRDSRITVIRHAANRGVGGAVISGYRKALELGCDIAVKVDGDGQMDSSRIPYLIEPLILNRADYTKANRFRDFSALKQMPRLRLFGNSALSFLVKAASGYWNLMDPTNGFTAIHRRVLEELDLDLITWDYFFESDMLIRLYSVGAVVKDIPVPARYGDESSSLSISNVVLRFPYKLLRGLVGRIFFNYFVYDFNMASVYMLIGAPLFLMGMGFGAVEWIDSLVNGVPKPAGTIMLAALPIITSLQMLLQAIQIDMDRVPRKH